MILTFIFAVFSLAAALFMLTFLNALLRELRQDRARAIEERQKSQLTFVSPERSRCQDRAA